MSPTYDPVLEGFSISIVHPMVIQRGLTSADRQMVAWRVWLKELAERPDRVPAGWAVRSPEEELDRLSIGRWSFREVKAQFFADVAFDSSKGADPDCEAIRPKLRWLGFAGPLRGAGLPENGVQLGNLKLGLMRRIRAKSGRKQAPGTAEVPVTDDAPEAEVELLNGSVNVFSLLSVAMVELLVIQLRFEKGLPLSKAMQVSHLTAHVDPADWMLVALPHGLVSQINRRRFEARSANGGAGKEAPGSPLLLSKDDLKSVMHFIHSRPGMAGEIDHLSRTNLRSLLGPSLPVLLQESLLVSAPVKDYWAPYHGRVPIAPRYLLPIAPEDGRKIGPDDLAAAWKAFESTESLVARGLPHPEFSDSFPVPMSEIQGPEMVTLHITGSQRFYLTCEGFYAVGFSASEFDRTQWMGRVARDYLATWLLVLHQGTLLQRISMDSYSGNERREARDNEYLMARLLEFSTEYDFHLVSPQRNIQAMYRTAREVLGVNTMVEEVSAELHRWVDDESRKEQKALNSVAVLALLAALATSFIGLNLSYFTNDSQIGFWFGDPAAPVPGLLWLGVPVVIVAAAILARRSLREHVRRVFRLLWRK